jgi:hypothetical protein
MNCRTARSLFSLHLDRYLSYEKERKLMKHLEECTACAAEIRGVEQTVGWVRDLPGIQPSETFLQDVVLAARRLKEADANIPVPGFKERLREFFARFSWTGSPLIAPAALVLGLAVGLGGTMLVSHGPGEDHPGLQVAATPEGLTVDHSEDAEALAPSGLFEDLVQEMLRRAELEQTETEEGGQVEDLEWGSPLDPDVQGRQVGTSAEDWRNRDTKPQVTVAY